MMDEQVGSAWCTADGLAGSGLTKDWSASEFEEIQIPQNRQQKEQHRHHVLRDAIQAADSTFTGCRANIMAARNAP